MGNPTGNAVRIVRRPIMAAPRLRSVGSRHHTTGPFAGPPDMRQHRGSIALARELRRLAAIVAADVVGYSRLMGRDESGTLARLRKNRSEYLNPVLTKYGGRLVKLTGDGALIE